MQFNVITLKRTPDRLDLFCSNNPEFQFMVFDAVDGTTLNRGELVANDLITPQIAARYTDGALGIAMSHKMLWERCVDINEPITVVEDDAYLATNIQEVAARITSIDDGWDFIFWGSNLDQNVTIEILPGITMSEFRTNHEMLVNRIDGFKQLRLSPTFFRCAFAIGLVCYSISPKGAKYLLENVFPIRDFEHGRYGNFGIDHSVMEELPRIQAYYSIPPLAVTKNDIANSTVQK